METDEDWICIFLNESATPTVDSHRDHRVVMLLALTGLYVPSIACEGTEAVSKTCPEFFELLNVVDLRF